MSKDYKKKMAKIKEKETLEKLRTREMPNAVDAEREVIGAMLLEQDAISKAIEVLKPENFYDHRHQKIFESMLNLFEENQPINVVTLFQELDKMEAIDEVGGPIYLNELTQDITSAVNVAFNARIVLEKWILRKIITSSIEMAEQAFISNKDVFDILDETEKTIFAIAEEGLKESYIGMDKAVPQTLEYIEAIHHKDLSSFAVPTGFIELDNMLGGFQKSDLIIIAARPSMGKTALALSIARNAAVMHKAPIAVFSLEMSTIQLVTRLISAESRINAHSIRTGKFRAEEGQKISKTVHKLQKAPIYIDDTPGQNVMAIRAKARRLKMEHNIQMIVIDYLQLMTSAGKMESREREISSISMSLKALAKELNIPVVALAQLNRSVEQRHDKRPMLSDLRESGSIEQDADVVLFLYRPEVYGITQLPEGDSTEGYAEIVIGKQRNGPVGSVPLQFIKEYARFENRSLDYKDMPQNIEEGNNDKKEIPF